MREKGAQLNKAGHASPRSPEVDGHGGGGRRRACCQRRAAAKTPSRAVCGLTEGEGGDDLVAVVPPVADLELLAVVGLGGRALGRVRGQRLARAPRRRAVHARRARGVVRGEAWVPAKRKAPPVSEPQPASSAAPPRSAAVTLDPRLPPLQGPPERESTEMTTRCGRSPDWACSLKLPRYTEHSPRLRALRSPLGAGCDLGAPLAVGRGQGRTALASCRLHSTCSAWCEEVSQTCG